MLRRAMQRAGLRVRKVSYSNALILAPVVLVRLLKTLLQKRAQLRNENKDPETDFMPVPGWANRLLIKYYQGEARFISRSRLPFGLSVVCVAQKGREAQP
jgi:hypothetical protein